MPRAARQALHTRAIVSLWGSADRVRAFLASVLEPHGVTVQQYNVLRILRGADPEGLPTLAVAERLIERAPGITRMIDRLESKGLVARRRGDDRRCVHCTITPAGLALLAQLDRLVDRADRDAFAGLRPAELKRLVALLERLRASHNPESR